MHLLPLLLPAGYLVAAALGAPQAIRARSTAVADPDDDASKMPADQKEAAHSSGPISHPDDVNAVAPILIGMAGLTAGVTTALVRKVKSWRRERIASQASARSSWRSSTSGSGNGSGMGNQGSQQPSSSNERWMPWRRTPPVGAPRRMRRNHPGITGSGQQQQQPPPGPDPAEAKAAKAAAAIERVRNPSQLEPQELHEALMGLYGVDDRGRDWIFSCSAFMPPEEYFGTLDWCRRRYFKLKDDHHPGAVPHTRDDLASVKARREQVLLDAQRHSREPPPLATDPAFAFAFASASASASPVTARVPVQPTKALTAWTRLAHAIRVPSANAGFRSLRRLRPAAFRWAKQAEAEMVPAMVRHEVY
ncbi:MAG: hypothetical protein M1826_005249 [Phylliscum demangeonii]|nr:MAG: hypothetical protein M1826_005249 [Phylliscum demangeonii]